MREDPKPAAKPVKVPTYDVAAVGADQIAAALARAKREDKRVLVQWGANWCGWCNLLAATMKEDKAIAKEVLYEYEVVKIDVGRFDKHVDLAQKYGAAIDGGIPFLTFLDADGKVLATSDGPQGNTGFPAAPGELAHFRTMLAKAATKITPAEIDALITSLVPKKKEC